MNISYLKQFSLNIVEILMAKKQVFRWLSWRG